MYFFFLNYREGKVGKEKKGKAEKGLKSFIKTV